MKRKFLTLIAAVAAAMALALSAGAEAATPETAGSLTPLMPMFDTADTGIAEYSGDIVQEDAATYDASYNANEDVAANERDVYNYLTGTMGMNSAAASGVMASMYRESRFYVDITNDYGTAYGLCQWYGDRWTNLQNYCNNHGLDWHTLYGQMRFLEYELNSLSSLRSYMYGISNDANGAYHAGYEWCRVYELGGNTSDTTRCDSRGTLARDTFWPKYQNGSTGGYTGWRSENGRDYWYENGVKQGTTGRGKEIYDASSDAWYWLDAVDGGAKAVNKDVYQESDGGKWVRYDENGHMIKGENCQNGNWYYFEPVTGAMIHGPWTLPDGRKVYYDLTTGIMQYGNVSINGSLYYFDPVYGTMKSGALTNFWVTDGNGKSFWYESWVRQGWQPGSSNYRGKEIYDPASGAWYWLDNVQQGAKAVSKDVYQESEAGDWAENADGTGKWVRYDANGHMVKGWDTNNDGTYYFDQVYGTMAKGIVTIDGNLYLFDVDTGVMQASITASEEAMADRVIELVNQERTSRGLQPLLKHDGLMVAAAARAKELSQRYSHTRPNGSECFTILWHLGIDYGYAGENIAMGQRTPEIVMNDWMNSSGHRANILNENFDCIGVGYTMVDGHPYWVQLFTGDFDW